MHRESILITGATDGIGRATALALGRLGHRIILHGGSSERLDQTLVALEDESGSDDHEVVQADLSSLDEVMSMAASLKNDAKPLGVLINNAGVYMPERRLTRDGFETTFAVNHLSHFLLTLELLDVLADGRTSRIINVSSVVHHRATIDYRDLSAASHYSGYGAYAQSKLANVLFTRSLSARLDAGQITANALHPGVISTKLLRAGFSMTGASVEEGAATCLYLATAPELEGVSGRYYADCSEQAASQEAMDTAEAERLWEVSVEMVQSVLTGWTPPL